MPSSRSYDRNPNSNQNQNHHHHRGGGFSGRHHLPFDSPPPNYPPPMGFRPTSGFRPAPESGAFMGGVGGYPMPHAGQKRRGISPSDGADGSSFAKLFVGSVPKTATEEDVRPLFEEHGDVIEVALLKDKRTGQQQGCCFIKYATPEEADRAIGALHNKYTLPGGTGPIQVRFADGERERLGAVEHKLFVGSLNKQATEKEIEEVFSPYGRVEDVYIMRDEVKQSRGCGFVKFSHREMAAAAIAALNGIYVMRGCEQPLTVRFADPKRPRGGELRGAPTSGGPGFGSRSQAFQGARPPPYLGEPMGGPAPPNAWHPMSPQSGGPSPHVNTQASGSHLTNRGSVAPVPTTMGGPLGIHGGPMNGSPMGFSVPPHSFQQNSNQPLSHTPSAGQQVSPMQKPLQSPQRMLPPFQPHSQQMPVSYSQKETPPISVQQAGQLQNPSSTSQSSSTQLSSQQLFGLSGQEPRSQSQVQQTPSSAVPQLGPLNYQRQGLPGPVSQQQLLQPLQQSPTQLAQVLSQQTQALQASFQSSQQAFSQLQQQLHLIQQSSQNPSQHQATQSHATKQSSPWPAAVPLTGASTPAAPSAVVTTASSAATGPASMQMPAAQTCNWTEHTSPEGYKYYYNSVTAESRWEKPEEMILFEQQQQQKQQLLQPPQPLQQQPQPLQQQPQLLQQQPQPLQQQLQPLQQQPQLLQQQVQLLHQQPQLQQKPSVQLQPQSHPQVLSSQQASQTQPVQLQTQIHNQQQFQLQRTLLPSSDLGYAQPQPVPNFGIDPSHYQQGPQSQAAQEWMWKNKPAGA